VQIRRKRGDKQKKQEKECYGGKFKRHAYSLGWGNRIIYIGTTWQAHGLREITRGGIKGGGKIRKRPKYNSRSKLR